MANVKQIKQKTTGTLLDIEDTQARSDIASEITNRTNADKALDDKVKAETEARTSADNALNQKIVQETTNRTNADNALQEKINTNKNDISELKDDLINVNNTKADKSDLAKTNLYLDALYKLNRGQTYDVLEQESEAYSVDVPSGAKYVGIDKVGGKSVVWNQLVCSEATGHGGTLDVDGGVYTLTPNTSNEYSYVRFYNSTPCTRKNGNKYYASIEAKSDAWASGRNVAFCTYDGLWLKGTLTNIDPSNHSWQKLKGLFTSTTDATGNGEFCFRKYYEETNSPVSVKNAMVFDLTQMFGAGNEPSTVEELESMFPLDYYPYSEPTIISSQTDRIEVASPDGTITQQITTGFPVLNSAGLVYDYIDLNEGKLYTWTCIEGNEVKALTEPVITDIEITTELTEWLTVETGGSVTFHNTDEGKRLLIPNKLSFIRKLDEVTV